MVFPSSASPASRPVFVALLPIVAVTFIMFLVTGVALPVIPRYVHDGLGFGTFAVGLVTGAQFTVEHGSTARRLGRIYSCAAAGGNFPSRG